MTSTLRLSMAAALSLALAAPALAQSSGTSGQTQGQATGQAQMTMPPATATADADAQAQADFAAQTRAHKLIESVKQKGAKTSAEARAKTEAKLETAAMKCDEQEQSAGDAKVAARLAAEFKMTTEQIMAEKQTLGCSWGQLMIAHCLDANANTELTVAQLWQMHQDGTGWGQISAGLGLKLGEAVSAVQAEGRVAAGLAKPDGKVAVIHGDGARAGASASVGANAGVHAGGAQVGAQSGIGVGLKIKP